MKVQTMEEHKENLERKVGTFDGAMDIAKRAAIPGVSTVYEIAQPKLDNYLENTYDDGKKYATFIKRIFGVLNIGYGTTKFVDKK